MFTILLTVSACGKPPVKDIDPTVVTLYNNFVAEANTQGIDVSNDDISIHFVDTLQGNMIGLCHDGYEVSLSRLAWSSLTEHEKEMLVYHELGHCLLNLGHAPSPAIMEPVMISQSWYKEHRDEAVYELFRAGRETH